MKLNYRDRIILIVAAVIVILAIGIFVLIKPRISDISTNKAALANAEKSWAEIEKEIAEIPKLQEKIKTLHAEAKEKTTYFTEPLESYKLDQFLQQYIDKHDLKLVSGMTINDPMVAELSFYYYTPNVLTYSLYETADLDGSLKKELEEKMKDATVLSARTAQEVETRTVSFTASAEKADLMNFLADIKALDTTILATSVSVNDYTFCPEDSIDMTEMDPAEREEAEEQIDHSDVTITIDFYSIQQPTEPKLEQ